MITHKDPAYIFNGDTTGDVVGPWIRTSAFERCVFQIAWSAAPGNFVGTITVEVTGDEPGALIVPAYFQYVPSNGGPTSSIVSQSIGGTSAGYGLLVVGDVNLCLPEFVRLKYAFSSGGQASHMQVTAIGRQ